MANFPISSSTGDPVFRAQNSSINTIRSFTRIQADASVKLNNQERIVSPGDDALSFSTSRKIRTEIRGLQVVQETGQLNVTGIGLALEGLDSIKEQLDNIKKNLVQSQVADTEDQADIQAQIDLALKQIDSTAKNTKLGSRNLLDGTSEIKAYASITSAGVISDFAIRNNGESLAQTSGIQDVRVNKIGVGGPTKLLDDGGTALSLNFQIQSGNKASKAYVALNDNGNGATSSDFIELRVTGKLGSATIRLSSAFGSDTANLNGAAESFNRLAQETGVVIASGTGDRFGFTTVGYGSDEFVKVEIIAVNDSAGSYELEFNAAGTTLTGNAVALGTTVTEHGTAAKATINGTEVELGGQYGTTARYLVNGYDLEIDFGTLNLAGGSTNSTTGVQGADTVAITGSINIDLRQGVTGILGTSGDSGDILQYSIGNFTSESLGRGTALNTVTVVSNSGNVGGGLPGANDALGNQVVGQYAVADLSSSGRLSLDGGNLQESLRTIDRAIDQVTKEQTRLGSIQGNFIDAVGRAEVGIGNLSSADADIIGVDAATEITNLVQASLGVSTASSVLAQANNIQQTIFSLLR